MIDPAVKLIAVVGPTASGKSDLALNLAKKYAGEILCADSRTVYCGLDIGSAKPSAADRADVPHHLLDLVDPDHGLSVAEFKRLAEAVATDVSRRGNIPLLVGGSGLYIDSVLYDYQFPSEADPTARAELDELSTEDLILRLQVVSPSALETIDIANRRRLIRAIETAGQPLSKAQAMRANTLAIGIALNKEVMQKRISERIEIMLSQGFLEEVEVLGERYGWDCEAMSGIGYRAFKEAIKGKKTVEEAAQEVARGDMRLVKKQLTWFKRNKEIHWVENHSEAEELVQEFLSN
jgi:tRNA dimethylallyltransferase